MATSIMERAKTLFGGVDILINNAGIIHLDDFVDFPEDAFDRVQRVNLKAPFLIGQAAARVMITQGRGGSIVNMSSRAAVIGSPGEFVHYAATKAALDTLTVGLSVEVAAEGIRVNGIAVGLVDTDFHAAAGEPGRAERMRPLIPMERSGSPEEVAAAAVWLLSDAASYTTGTTLRVSGGR